MKINNQHKSSNAERGILLTVKPRLLHYEKEEIKQCFTDIDWEQFSTMALSTGLTGTIHSRLREAKIDIPTHIRNHWLAWSLAVEQENKIRLAEAKDILIKLEKEDLPVVPIKGMALFLKPDIQDLSLRSSCDIDLVTLPQHVDAIESLLLTWGYTSSEHQESFIRHHHHRVYTKPSDFGEITVELHWTFLYKTFGREEYDQAIMGRTHKNAEGIRTLDPNDFLLSLLLHLAQHRYRGQLKWVTDIAIAASQPDTDFRVLRERAKEFGVLQAVNYGLWLTEILLTGNKPQKIDWRTQTLSILNPPLELLRDPREPNAWRRPIIDVLLHDKIHRGITRALFRTSKVLEDKYSFRLPNWMVLNKE